MSNNITLKTALMVTTLLTAGAAFAATQDVGAAKPPATSSGLNNTERDFGKLSTDGARAYQDVALARAAIFEGQTGQAKQLVSEAESELGKAQRDDTVFLKAENQLKAAPQAGNAAPAANENASKPIAWIPVDGVVSLDEDYKATPEKTKAVAEANEHLRKGDRNGAMERLKLADVGVSVVQAVLPLQRTIGAVHQASSLINDGKFYEGSQELRKIQASTRFDIATFDRGANGGIAYSRSSDAGPGKNQASSNMAMMQAPEPYSAPDPQYAPMASEPIFHPTQPAPVSLSDNQTIQGSAAAPEPYSAPDPQYKPMTSEPVFHQPTAAPSSPN